MLLPMYRLRLDIGAKLWYDNNAPRGNLNVRLGGAKSSNIRAFKR